jgi:hypothetical protein
MAEAQMTSSPDPARAITVDVVAAMPDEKSSAASAPSSAASRPSTPTTVGLP